MLSKNEDNTFGHRLSRLLVLWLMLVICGRGEASPQAPNPTSFQYKIFLDPGHGGRDCGAHGLYGLEEKELASRMSHLLREELLRQAQKQKISMEVRLSREDDIYLTLSERVQKANRWGADLFLSVHGNSSPLERARGFEVYFLSEEASDEAAGKLALSENRTSPSIKSEVASILRDVEVTQHISESSDFAVALFKEVSFAFKPNGRGVRQAPFTVLAQTRMPSALFELGYVTQASEAKNLMKAPYLKRLAGAISRGILEYLSSKKRVL